MKRVRLLSNSPNVRLLPFGKSGAGRPIPAYVISDFSVDPANKARMLVVAGQHGDEYNPVRSILTLSRQLAAGYRDDLIRRCVIVVVPMANPDGIAAGCRLNADGTDINRDWLARHTCEARFVHSIIKAWRPQAIVDLHEWMGPSRVPENAVGLPQCNRSAQSRAMAGLCKRISRATGLAVVKEVGGNTSLLHRRYSQMGYASYLIETAPGEDYAVKSHAYICAVEQVAESLAADPGLRLALSPSSAAFSLAGVISYLEPIATGPLADPESSALAMLALAVAAYCLMMWVLKPMAARGEPTWSHRFRKCSIDWDIDLHPFARKHALEPLTSRSWTHRRLRARYAAPHSVAHTGNRAELSY
jgi:hypothetical protein